MLDGYGFELAWMELHQTNWRNLIQSSFCKTSINYIESRSLCFIYTYAYHYFNIRKLNISRKFRCKYNIHTNMLKEKSPGDNRLIIACNLETCVLSRVDYRFDERMRSNLAFSYEGWRNCPFFIDVIHVCIPIMKILSCNLYLTS